MIRYLLCGFLAAWFFECGAGAQEPAEDLAAIAVGQTDSLDVNIRVSSLASDGPVWWLQEFTRSGADWIRLEFQVRETGPDGSRLIVEGPSRQREEFDVSRTATLRSAWTQVFEGDRIVVSFEAPERPTRLDIRLSALSYEHPPGERYSIIGNNDIESVGGTDVPEIAARVKPPVAKLLFQSGGFPRTCSGFLIDASTLMTNQHCINSQEACGSLAAVFGNERDAQGRLSLGKQYRCVQFDASRVNFDLDVALVEMAGRPGDEWGKVEFAATDVTEGASLFIIHHPNKAPKMISRIDCSARHLAVDGRGSHTDFTHSCDTESGSSGAPVFSEEGKVVGLHHFGFADDGPSTWTENRAIRIDALRSWLSEIGYGSAGSHSVENP